MRRKNIEAGECRNKQNWLKRKAEQLEQAIQAATGGKAATILVSRTRIEMVNELKEKPIFAALFCNITTI